MGQLPVADIPTTSAGGTFIAGDRVVLVEGPPLSGTTQVTRVEHGTTLCIGVDYAAADAEYAEWFGRPAPLTDTEALSRRFAAELNAMIAARSRR